MSIQKSLKTALALSLALMLTLTGCGGGASTSSSSGASSGTVGETTDKGYSYTSTEVQVPARSTEIPATLVVPEGKEGEKFPLVVINHSHGGSAADLEALANALGERGIASISMDFAGCGRSTDPFTNNSLFFLITDSNASLEYALQNAPIDPERLGIFGYSMGGRVALEVTTGPTNAYQAMALLAPSADQGEAFMAHFLGGEDAYQTLYAKAATEQGYADFITPFNQEQQLGMSWFEDLKRSNPLKNIANYQGDLLVIYGDADTTVPPAVSHSVIEAATPTAKSVEEFILPGADHGYGLYNGDTTTSDQVIEKTVNFFAEKLK